MDKELAARALDAAFNAHVEKCFAQTCQPSNEAGYDDARRQFALMFRSAQRFHADAVAALGNEDADIPEMEDDNSYRARILAAIGPSPRNNRAVSVSASALDAYGLSAGVKRAPRAPDNPDAPEGETDADRIARENVEAAAARAEGARPVDPAL